RIRTQLAILFVLVLAQRIAEEAGAYPTLPARTAYPPIPLLEPLRKDSAPFRIAGVGDSFPPGTSAMYGLQDVRGYEPMTLKRYADTYPLWCAAQPVWFNRVDDLTRPFLSLLNVRYAIASEAVSVPDSWREVRSDRGARLFENTRVLDRAFIPRTIRLGVSEADELIEMDHATDFADVAWVRAAMPAQQRDNGPGRVTTIDHGSELLLTAEMQRAGWIILSEPSWKGWRAYVDSSRVETQIANRALLAVYVPAGKHNVRLIYRPESFVIGRAISAIALIAFAVLLARTRRTPDRSGGYESITTA
ncbi:MAG TPA: YfhO family protein, partial [Thermoanaerobaculia bacterium]